MNQIVTLVINILLLVVYYFVIVKTGNDGNGQLAKIIDYCYLLSCIIDPLIYVVWLRETRLELLKMVQVIFPYFSKTIEDMRIDILTSLPLRIVMMTTCEVFKKIKYTRHHWIRLVKGRICIMHHLNRLYKITCSVHT